jgi:hypothetical protein
MWCGLTVTRPSSFIDHTDKIKKDIVDHIQKSDPVTGAEVGATGPVPSIKQTHAHT